MMAMEEIGWLVERGGKWWGPQCSEWEWQHALTGCEPSLWTADANKALRFARQEDANAFIKWEGLGGGVEATEHIWIGGRHIDESTRDAAIQRFRARLDEMLTSAANRILTL